MSMVCNLLDLPDAHLDQLLAAPESIRVFIDEEDEFTERIDKAWHGINFVLTGQSWGGDEPLCYLTKGGETVGSVRIGWGPPRALRSPQVAAFHEALAAISDSDFQLRFDAKALEREEIYPGRWQRDEEQKREYLLGHFQKLKSFVAQAKADGVGILIWIS